MNVDSIDGAVAIRQFSLNRNLTPWARLECIGHGECITSRQVGKVMLRVLPGSSEDETNMLSKAFTNAKNKLHMHGLTGSSYNTGSTPIAGSTAKMIPAGTHQHWSMLQSIRNFTSSWKKKTQKVSNTAVHPPIDIPGAGGRVGPVTAEAGSPLSVAANEQHKNNLQPAHQLGTGQQKAEDELMFGIDDHSRAGTPPHTNTAGVVSEDDEHNDSARPTTETAQTLVPSLSEVRRVLTLEEIQEGIERLSRQHERTICLAEYGVNSPQLVQVAGSPPGAHSKDVGHVQLLVILNFVCGNFVDIVFGMQTETKYCPSIKIGYYVVNMQRAVEIDAAAEDRSMDADTE
ncbi:hypothetical protein BDZ91DRAFT_765139 [Kalaharituber pfeilii]|nr:hypothetical protein BDZ91DRAFT_765139 [Kalaharituber pfeilii]